MRPRADFFFNLHPQLNYLLTRRDTEESKEKKKKSHGEESRREKITIYSSSFFTDFFFFFLEAPFASVFSGMDNNARMASSSIFFSEVIFSRSKGGGPASLVIPALVMAMFPAKVSVCSHKKGK